MCSVSNLRNQWLSFRLLDVVELREESSEWSQQSACWTKQRACLALSHCWGQQKFLIFYATSQRAFESLIHQSQLALNFRDAIHTTRTLERSLYLGTSVAANSRDAHGDFFRKRIPGLVIPQEDIKFNFRARISGKIAQQKAYIQVEWLACLVRSSR